MGILLVGLEMLALLSGIVYFVIFIVRAIKKQKKKIPCIIALISFTVFFVAEWFVRGFLIGLYLIVFDKIKLLFIAFAILGVVINIFAKKTDNKWLWALFLIMIVVVSFFSIPFFASFSSKEFLEHTTHYVSGGSMNGYEFWFWTTLFIYPIISEIISSKISGKRPLWDK